VIGVLLAHLVGDYLLQSDWMATEKTKKWWPAWVHALAYGLPFLLVTQSPAALAVIVCTHAVIDRYRLVRYLLWVKNFAAPRSHWLSWKDCAATGYSKDLPVWLSTWLMIIADNTVHMLINVAAVRWL
jgi:hypothetical protein